VQYEKNLGYLRTQLLKVSRSDPLVIINEVVLLPEGMGLLKKVKLVEDIFNVSDQQHSVLQVLGTARVYVCPPEVPGGVPTRSGNCSDYDAGSVFKFSVGLHWM
jgi:hypothetical protein